MIIAGGCFCGTVRYEAAGEPIATAICHCTNCQRQSGSALSINLVVPRETLRTEGRLRSFEDRGDSGGRVTRQFCPECGSPIISLLEAAPEIAIIKAGTLDDPSGISPQMQLWCRSAQPWTAVDASVPAYPENPPAA